MGDKTVHRMANAANRERVGRAVSGCCAPRMAELDSLARLKKRRENNRARPITDVGIKYTVTHPTYRLYTEIYRAHTHTHIALDAVETAATFR